jgi:hypothetical protein
MFINFSLRRLSWAEAVVVAVAVVVVVVVAEAEAVVWEVEVVEAAGCNVPVKSLS